ncbi:MAG: glycine cleavage system protein GcvH [Bacteroidetes bacterium]|nr:glycine cleavage system protein GcvH [Bacteroidota bacterium]MCH8245015.1 glycine cleavage system protein GcvH [Bacteroidota bacterium]
MEFPSDLYYTQDHEWLRYDQETETCMVGITEFAQSELGDIVFVEIDELDNDLAKDDPFGTVEAVKTVAELFMPVSGTVQEMNESLEDSPELLNNDPYGEGWIIMIKLSDPSEISQLLSVDEYAAVAGS